MYHNGIWLDPIRGCDCTKYVFYTYEAGCRLPVGARWRMRRLTVRRSRDVSYSSCNGGHVSRPCGLLVATRWTAAAWVDGNKSHFLRLIAEYDAGIFRQRRLSVLKMFILLLNPPKVDYIVFVSSTFCIFGKKFARQENIIRLNNFNICH